MSTLFHYTTLPTFLAIIQNRSVRFCELSKSNDKAEGRFISESLQSLMTHMKIPDYIQASVSHILERLINIYSYYGFCMTSEGDDLGQWRAYADNGRGVAIGFDLDKLVECAKESPLSISTKVSQVRYGMEEILSLVDDLLETLRRIDVAQNRDFWSDPEALFRSDTQDAKALTFTIQTFSQNCYDIKNQSFLMEKETWITQETTFTASSFLKFFSRQNRIVPYYDVKINPDCLNCIVAGPELDISPHDISRVLSSWDASLISTKVYRSVSSVRI